MHLFSIVTLFSIHCSLSWAQSPLVGLSADGSTVNAPSRRSSHSFNYDNNGGFWIFGGNDLGGWKNDLWRFNRASRTFTFIDGSNGTNANATILNKPTARLGHATWVDTVGNLWLFGGRGYAETGISEGYLSDTWVFNPSSSDSNKWTFVTGSKVINQPSSSTLGPRKDTGHWRDVSDNCLYVFGGDGYYGYFQSVWRLDPTIANPTWRFVFGSNVTSAGAVINGQPVPRYYHSCDGAPNSGAYCFGGWSYLASALDDLWQFTPTPNPQWTQITQPNGPTARRSHEVVINRAVGKVYVLFGINSTSLSDIYLFTLSTQQWSPIVSSSSIVRNSFGADIDDRNMIYYFGGSGSSRRNDAVAITCLFGEVNNAGTCTNCIAGSYSSTYNASTCTLCPENTFSTTAGATSSSICLSCPNNLGSISGSSACSNFCAKGYQPNSGSCVACGPGSYQATLGNSSCIPCDSDTYSTTTAATSCLPCSNNSRSTIGSLACSCDAGYQPNESACVACPAGSFKTTAGNWTCTACGVGTYSSGTASTTSSICLPCGSNSASVAGSSACLCNAGFEPISNACNQCSVGFFKAASGNTSCVACANNQFSLAGATSCLTCPTNSVATAGSGSCSCNVGFTSNGTACVACEVGSFKTSVGNSSCTACGTNAGSVAGSASCSCNAGYQPNESACVACPAGSFKTTAGNWTCTACGVGTYSSGTASTTSSVCLPCGSNSASVAGSSACLCKAGYEPVGNECNQCSAGSYKTINGNWSCTQCGLNTYSIALGATSSGTCSPCDTNLGASPGSSSCTCNAGYEFNGQSCIACSAGSYKSNAGNSSCIQCPANTYLSTTGATSASACLPCGPNSASDAGSSWCSCNAGYQSYGTSCVPCGANTFKLQAGNITTCTPCSGDQSSLAGASACITCSSSTAPAPLTNSSFVCSSGYEPSESSCTRCRAGTYKSSTGNWTCTPCAAGTFSGDHGASSGSVCLPCGANANSLPGSSLCTCNAGFQPNGESCTQCPAGSYKVANGNWSCTLCPADTYSTSLGAMSNNVCTSCTDNAVSLPGSTTCTCDAGYTLVETMCTACSPGFYKPTSGNIGCLPCSANTYSTSLAATSINSCMPCGPHMGSSPGSTTCSCNAGYESVGMNCVACTAGKFKANSGNATRCEPCSDNQNSLTGATACLTCNTNAAPASQSSTSSTSTSATNTPTTSAISQPTSSSAASSSAPSAPGGNSATSSPTSLPIASPTPSPTTSANPLASLMGVSDEVFFIIVGSVGGALLAAIAAAVVIIRKRNKKRKQLLLATMQMRRPSNMTGAPGTNTLQRQQSQWQQQQQQPQQTEMKAMGENYTGGNVIMPYGTGARASNLLSMSRTGTVFPNSMVQSMAPSYYITNGATGRTSYNDETIATTGPSWRQ